MKRLIYSLIALSFLLTISPKASAQEEEFALADGRVGETYRQNIPRILRDEYGKSVASGGQKAALQWAGVGKLPPGLTLNEDGTISGKPRAYKELPYIFRVKITDTLSPEADPLVITLKMKVLPPKLRLVNVSGAATATPSETDEDASDGADTEQSGGEEATQGKTQGQPLCRSKKIVVEAVTAPLSDNWEANIRLKNPAIKKLNVFIQGPSPAAPKVETFTVSNALVRTRFTLNPGKNKVTVFGLDDGDNQVECTALAVEVPAASDPGQPRITLGDNFRLLEPPPFPLSVKLEDPGKVVDQLRFVVRDKDNVVVNQGSSFVDRDAPGNMQRVVIKLAKGKNTVTVTGRDVNDAQVTNSGRITIECAEQCGNGASAEAAYDEIISITPPVFRVLDQPDTKLIVNINNTKTVERKVDRLYYTVTDDRGIVVDEGTVKVERKDAAEATTIQPLVVSLAPSASGDESSNAITVFGLDDSTNNPQRITNIATAHVACLSCNGPSTKLTGNSLHTRAIVGFEQVGGSGATSTQKPFLDLFFSAPIGKKASLLTPAFQVWGNARIASLAQQTNPANPVTLGTFATSGFLTNLQTADVNTIAQGFDFLVGIDVKLIPRNAEGYFSLIPGTRQRTSLSFIASFGGITPLQVDKEIQSTTPIFKIPTLANGNPDPEFIKRFPDAEGKKNIAFVAPTRDRFYRQYYGGIRVKTLFFDKRDNPINRFPAIFDLTIGQNELVTGHLRNVVRFEGFYPFPFRAASFFYFYGTALMKLGRNGGRTELPLFLEQATGAQVTSPDTALVPIDRNPTLRSSRDSYRLGVGINLIELLNRLRDQSRPQ